MNTEQILKTRFTHEDESFTGNFFPTVKQFIFEDFEGADQFGGDHGRAGVQGDFKNLKPMQDYERYTKHMKPLKVNNNLQYVIDAEQINVEYSQEGIFYDYMADEMGEDNCMLNVQSEMHERHVVYLAVPVSAALHLEHDEFCRRGKAMTLIVDAFNSQNIDVGIIAFDGTRADYKVDFQVVQVKAPQQEINRTQMIRLLSDERINTRIALSRGLRNLGTNYGGDVNLTPEILAQVHPNIKANEVHIISSSDSHNLVNDKDAAQKLYDMAAEQLAQTIKHGRA